MNRTGRALTLGCLLLLPLLSHAGDNSLLVPVTGRCMLNAPAEELESAIQACQQAADAGDVAAEYELGELYYQGKRIRQDYGQALHWFERASLKGNAQAQYQLGRMFFQGEGVQANPLQAYIVLKMAAVNGAEQALDTADQVSEQMNSDDLSLAQQVLGQIFRTYMQAVQFEEPRSTPPTLQPLSAEPPTN